MEDVTSQKIDNIVPEMKIEIENHDIKSELLPQVFELCYIAENSITNNKCSQVEERCPSFNSLTKEVPIKAEDNVEQLPTNTFLNLCQPLTELKIVIYRENLEEKKKLLWNVR